MTQHNNTGKKLMATAVGLVAAAYIIKNIQVEEKYEEDLIENWDTGVRIGPMMQMSYTTDSGNEFMIDPTLRNVSTSQPRATANASLGGGKNLLGHLPETAFFGNAEFQPTTMNKFTNMKANNTFGARMEGLNALGGAPLYTQGGLNAQFQLNNASKNTTNLEAHEAANMARLNRSSSRSRSRSRSPMTRRSSSRSRSRSPMTRRSSSPGRLPSRKPSINRKGCGCGTQLNALPSMAIDSIATNEIPLGAATVNFADGEVLDVYANQRLMYSTLSRARCPGTVDMIRGDLPITPCAQLMMPAARPADTLATGAFAAMFGTDARGAGETAALVAADQGFVQSAYGGMDLGYLATENQRLGLTNAEPPINTSTFLSSSAAQANALLQTSEVTQKSIGTNSGTGEVVATTGRNLPFIVQNDWTAFP